MYQNNKPEYKEAYSFPVANNNNPPQNNILESNLLLPAQQDPTEKLIKEVLSSRDDFKNNKKPVISGIQSGDR